MQFHSKYLKRIKEDIYIFYLTLCLHFLNAIYLIALETYF